MLEKEIVELSNVKANKKKGFTLIELLLVIGFIAAALVGAFVVYPKVKTNQVINNEATNISTIIAGVQNLYAGQTTYAGLTNTVVNQSNITPSTMRTATVTDIRDGWNNNLTILQGSGKRFTVTYPAVPQDACVKFVTSVGSNALRVGTAAANAVPAAGADGTVNILDRTANPQATIDVAALATACAAATTIAVQLTYQ